MNNIPTGTRVKMPALSKLNRHDVVEYNNIESAKKINYTNKASMVNFITTTNPPTAMKSTVISPRINLPNGKISVDGKIVGIDVLTKLQQQNVGNIVSFTASKEFLSNLTNSKFPVSKTILQTNKSDPSVFRVTKPNVIHHSVVKKIAGEKILLPKTQLNGLKQNSNFEVKKFAPEIKGLLTGLSTALKTTTIATTTSQSFHLLKTTTLLPIANMNGGTLQQGKGNVLIALKTTSKPLTYISTGTTRSLPAISTFKTNLSGKPAIQNTKPKALPQPKYQQQEANVTKQTPQQIQVITTGVNKTKVNAKNTVICSNHSNTSSKKHYFDKASSVSASINGKIDLFRKNNQIITQQVSKQTPLNSKRSDESIPTSVVKTLLNLKRSSNNRYAAKKAIVEKHFISKTPSAQMQYENNYGFGQGLDDQRQAKSENQTAEEKEKSNKSIIGFTELYETAVQNVLNIKAFPNDLMSEKENSSNFKDFEKDYKDYLKAPMRKKRTLPLLNEDKLKDLPSEKKPKLEIFSPSYGYKSPDKSNPSSNSEKKSVSDFFDFKYNKNREHIKTRIREIDAENRRFFSQFLSAENSLASFNDSRSYYSSSDFPWFHSSYFHDPYYHPIPHYYQTEHYEECESKNNKTNRRSPEPSRMKLLTAVKKEGDDKNTKSKLSPDEEVKKINKNKKTPGKSKSGSNRSTPSKETEKNTKTKEIIKMKRYTLRQRALALKKAKKLALTMPPEPPKFVLKEMTAKSITKKELFLGSLGLRRILKRFEKKVKNNK